LLNDLKNTKEKISRKMRKEKLFLILTYLRPLRFSRQKVFL